MPSHPPSAQDLAGRIIDAETGTTALHQAAQKGTLQNLCGVTAALLATVKDNYGWTPLHHAANCGHLDQIPGVTAAFLTTVKDNDGKTPLHDAAWRGHLDQIPGVTAEFLATVKNNDGETPLHIAASEGHLDQIPDITTTLATTLNILDGALRPENISAFTEDFRRHGAHYNHCPTIRTALIEAANQLPDLQLPNAPPSKPPSAPHKRAASCYLPNSSPSYYRSRPQGTRTGAASQSAAPAQ